MKKMAAVAGAIVLSVAGYLFFVHRNHGKREQARQQIWLIGKVLDGFYADCGS